MSFFSQFFCRPTSFFPPKEPVTELALPDFSLKSMFALLLQTQRELHRPFEIEMQLTVRFFLDESQLTLASRQVADIRRQPHNVKFHLKMNLTIQIVQPPNQLREDVRQWHGIPLVEFHFH